MHLYISQIIPSIDCLGPGKRIGIWVQGCSLGCKGCMSPQFASFNEQSRMELEEVFQKILCFSLDHTGVTVTGGEPFEQAVAMEALLKMIREHTHLDLLVYSGYTLKEIRHGSQAMRNLLQQADVLIDGRYRHDKPTRKIWRGSDNQVMHLISERGDHYKKYVKAEYIGARPLQISMKAEHGLQIVGIPEPGFINQMFTGMLDKGIVLSP